MRPSCKSCMDSVVISEDVIEELLNEAKVDKKSIIANEAYNERLQHCLSCPSLMDGTTCMHSGNFVQFRAKITGSTCPFPAGSKWTSDKQLA